jgi:cell wall-associated NlpC family hydrolase
MAVYKLAGLNLPRSTTAQFNAGTPVRRSDLVRGDLVFFRTSGGNRISHVGIYAGDNKFIHAPSSNKAICVDSLDKEYFKRRYAGGRRYLE